MTGSSTARLLSRVRSGRGRRGLGATAVAMALTLAAPAAANAVFNPNLGTLPGHIQFRAVESEPTAPYDPYQQASTSALEFDQRKMYFGEVATYTTDVMQELSSTGKTCGSLIFKVTRYQSYWLVWHPPTGADTVLLYRGGLVADYGRPYVGVFLGAGNKLEIRTYNRRIAYDQYGDPIPGAVYNSWTAASITAPTNRISLEKNGLWSVNSAGKKTAWKTGGTAC